MILAAGLTPAWQQTMLFETLRRGEVNRAREVHWCGSGKVLNVGVALHHLGADCRTLFLIGGPAYAAIEEEFSQMGLPRRCVNSSVPTRVCTTIVESESGGTTELVENALPISTADLQAFEHAYLEEVRSAEIVVLSGSCPAGTPVTFYRDLLAQTPARVILDARGSELLAALDAKPFVVKPNREELSQTLGRPILQDGELLSAMRELNRRGADWVVVTQGKGAVWVTSLTEQFRIQPPPVEVVNPIGCGDCLAAGIAAALAEGEELLKAVKFGMAAAAENARQLLPARLQLEQVKSWRDKIAVL